MGLCILHPAGAQGKLMLLVISQFKNSVYWWLGMFRAPPFMQSVCRLHGRSSPQCSCCAFFSWKGRRRSDSCGYKGLDRQTDRQLSWATSNEKVGSAQGRRVLGMCQEGRHTRLAGGRASHKKTTTAQPRPHAGNDNGHPRETKMSGFGAIRSFPASFLPTPPKAWTPH